MVLVWDEAQQNTDVALPGGSGSAHSGSFPACLMHKGLSGAGTRTRQPGTPALSSQEGPSLAHASSQQPPCPPFPESPTSSGGGPSLGHLPGGHVGMRLGQLSGHTPTQGRSGLGETRPMPRSWGWGLRGLSWCSSWAGPSSWEGQRPVGRELSSAAVLKSVASAPHVSSWSSSLCCSWLDLWEGLGIDPRSGRAVCRPWVQPRPGLGRESLSRRAAPAGWRPGHNLALVGSGSVNRT